MPGAYVPSSMSIWLISPPRLELQVPANVEVLHYECASRRATMQSLNTVHT